MEKDKIITYKEILKNEEIRSYIINADSSLASMGYTDHSFRHVKKCAKLVKDILTTLDYDSRIINLGQIAAYMHDIGNLVNRNYHALSGATMAFNILTRLHMAPDDISIIVSAIGNHDEGSGYPVNPVAAALILADKSDVSRARVRNPETYEFNIHDRVNYAVKRSHVSLDKENKSFILELNLDTKITPIMDYFEIFLKRMTLCRKAAEVLGIAFKLFINEQELI